MRYASLLALALLFACSADDGWQSGRSELLGRDPNAVTRESYARPALPGSREAWETRAAEVRGRLLANAQLERERPVPGAMLVGTRVIGEVILQDLLIDGFEGMRIPALLYLPAGAKGPVPGIVLNVGHDAAGQSASYIRKLGWRMASGGIAALSIDWLGMGARFSAEQRHVPLGLRSYLAGLLPQTPTLGEPLMAFDYLASRTEVDPTRIAFAGQSGGGVVSMHVPAMEQRIAAAVVVDIVCTSEYLFETPGNWGDPDAMLAGSFAYTSHAELLGLMAPRPLLVLSGDDDVIAPSKVTDEALGHTRAIYDLYGARDDVGFVGFPTKHCYCENKIAETLAFLGLAFLGAPIVTIADPPAGSEPRAKPLPEDPRWLDLLEPRYLASPSVDDFDPNDQMALRRDLEETLAFVRRTPGAVTLDPPPRGDADDVALLWLSDGARSEVLERQLLGMAPWVVNLDPAGMGSALALGDDGRRYLAQNANALGKPLLGLGVEDLLWAADSLRQAGARRVLVLCQGPQAALVCAAATGLMPDAIDGAVVSELPHDYKTTFAFGRPDPSLYYVTPGLGACANPEMLVALAAPRPVSVVGTDTTTWRFLPDFYRSLRAQARLDVTTSDVASAVERVLEAAK
jgi:dienelactone hydrolase